MVVNLENDESCKLGECPYAQENSFLDMKPGDDPHRFRDARFELLRLVSMALILFHHYVVHGGFQFLGTFSVNDVFLLAISSFGKLGVLVFTILSGYFLCKSRFHLKKLVLLVLEAFFYSVICALLGVALKVTDLNFQTFIIAFFPISRDLWWFLSGYVLLYLCSPLLRIITDHVSKGTLAMICVFGSVVYTIIPSISLGVLPGAASNQYLMFFISYFVGAYLRLYFSSKKNKILDLFLFFLLSIFMELAFFGVLSLSGRFPILKERYSFFSSINSFFSFFGALFLVFY